jgi:hypothetical protein
MSKRDSLRRFLTEFGIIVLGVLAALAVESAYQAWKNVQVEHAYMDELRKEANQNLNRIDAYVSETDSLFSKLEAVINAIEGGKSQDQEPAILNTLFRASWQSGLVTGGVTWSVYEDLISTGNIRLIRDPEVRNSLSQAYANQESIRQRVLHGNERIDSKLLSLLSGFYIPKSAGTQVGDYLDLQAVMRTENFRSELNREHHRFRYMLGYLVQLRPGFERLVEALKS